MSYSGGGRRRRRRRKMAGAGRGEAGRARPGRGRAPRREGARAPPPGLAPAPCQRALSAGRRLCPPWARCPRPGPLLPGRRVRARPEPGCFPRRTGRFCNGAYAGPAGRGGRTGAARRCPSPPSAAALPPPPPPHFRPLVAAFVPSPVPAAAARLPRGHPVAAGGEAPLPSASAAAQPGAETPAAGRDGK